MKYRPKRIYQVPNSPNNQSSLIHHQKQYSDYHVISPNQNKNEKIIHRSIKRNFDPEGNAIITTKIVREIDYDNNKNNINSNSIMNIRPKAVNTSFRGNNEHKLRYSNYSNNEEIENASAIYNNRNYGYDVFTPNTYESQDNNYSKINTYTGSGESDGGKEFYSAYRSPMTGKIINLKRGEISPDGIPNYTSGSDFEEINQHSMRQMGNKYIHNPKSNLNYSQRIGLNKVKYRKYNLESPYTQNDDFDSPDRNNDYNGHYFRNIQIDKIKGIQPIYQEKMNMMNNQLETSEEYERNININRTNWRNNNNSAIPRYYGKFADNRDYDLFNDAAIQLQANVRGYLVRKKVLRYITLALYYQSFCDKIQDILVFHVRGEVFNILKNKLKIKTRFDRRNNRESPYSNINSKKVITTKKEIKKYNITDINNKNDTEYKSRNIDDNLGTDKYKRNRIREKREYTDIFNNDMNDINTPPKTIKKEYSENIIFNRINRTNRPNKLDKNYCKKNNLNYSINYSNTEFKKFDYTVSPTKKVTHYYIRSPCSTNKPHNRFYQEIDDKSTNIYSNKLSTYRSYKNMNFRNFDKFGHYKYNKYENNTSTTFQDKPDYRSGIGTRSYSRGMVKTTYSSSNQNINKCHCLDDIRRQNINNENVNINIYRENDYETRKDLESQNIRKEVYTEKIIRKDERNERKYNYNRFNDDEIESDNYISLNIVKLPHRRVSSSDKKEEIYTKTVETKEYVEDKNKIEEPKKRGFSKIEVNKAETVKFMPLSKSKRDIFTNTSNEPNQVDKLETINIAGKVPKIDKEKERREQEQREIEIERRIKERIEIEKREIERIDRERKDKENQDRLEQEKKDKEKRDQEEQLLIERERKIQIEQEKIDKEWKEIERREKEAQRRREQDEKDRKDWEERERLENERRLKDDQDRRDRERRDKELRDRLDQERRDREKKEMEQLLVIEREKIIRIEKERLEKEMKERERKIRDENMAREREERLRKENLERLERERKLEEERRERERKEKEKKDKLERERKEKEKRDREERLRIEREERQRREERERLERERERKLKEDQERRERERKEKEKKDKLERERKEELLRIERERKARLDQERREKERKEQEAKRKRDREERDRLSRIKIESTKTTTTNIINRDRFADLEKEEKERKERIEKLLANINNTGSQKTTTTTTKITTRTFNTDVNRNLGNVGITTSKYTSSHYKPSIPSIPSIPNITTIKVKESGGGKYPSFGPGDEYILKKDCKKNLEEMKSKLEKEYQEKIEMEKKRGQEELRINQENIERKNKIEIERLIEMHKQKDNERVREIERERELSRKREMEIEKLKEKEMRMGLQIETDKQRELQRQKEIEEKNRKNKYIRVNKEIEINLKNAESFERKEQHITIKRDREKDILRAKEIIRIFILSRCDPLMKKRKYFNVWRRKAHLLELLENSKIIQEFCRSNLEMSRIKKVIKMWKDLSKKLFYKTRIKILKMRPKFSKKNIRIKKLYELIRITKLNTIFSRRRFIHFIILIWHIYAKNIHKKRVNMKYLYENLLKTYMSLANDIFGNNQYENPSVQDAMYEAVNTNKFITLMPDDVPLARKHYEEMRKIKSVDSKGNKVTTTTKVEIEKKEVQKKYYMGKINEDEKDEKDEKNTENNDDTDRFKKKKLDFLAKYRKNKFYNDLEKKSNNYSYTGRFDKIYESTEKDNDKEKDEDKDKDIKLNESKKTGKNKLRLTLSSSRFKSKDKEDKDSNSIQSNEFKLDNNIGTSSYLNRFKNKDDKDSVSMKSNENKIETNIGTSLYLNRFKNKDDKDNVSIKSNEYKIETNIGTSSYLNRFKNKDDKDSVSIKSNENKTENNIGTGLYFNRFNITNDNKEEKKKDDNKYKYNKYLKSEGNTNADNDNSNTNRFGYISRFRNKSDNKDDKSTFSYTSIDKNKDDGKYTSKYGNNVGISYTSNLQHTSSYSNIPKIETTKYEKSYISSVGKDKDTSTKTNELITQPPFFDTYQKSSYLSNITEEPKSYSKKIEIKTTTTTSSLPNTRLGNNNFIYNSNKDYLNTDNKTSLSKSNTENKFNFSYKSPALLNADDILKDIGNKYGTKVETKTIEKKYEVKPIRSNVGSSYDSKKIVTRQYKSTRFNP